MSIIFAKEKDGTINVHAAGYITHEPKVFDKIVLFSICYGKDKYYDCKAWRNDPAGKIASCLERHDVVMVDGVYDVYQPEGGEKKERIAVDAIVSVVATTVSASGPKTSESKASSGPFTEIDEEDSELPF